MAADQLRKNKGCSNRDGGQVMAAGQVCRDKDKKNGFGKTDEKLISGGSVRRMAGQTCKVRMTATG